MRRAGRSRGLWTDWRLGGKIRSGGRLRVRDKGLRALAPNQGQDLHRVHRPALLLILHAFVTGIALELAHDMLHRYLSHARGPNRIYAGLGA